jgi:hypothetical protein
LINVKVTQATDYDLLGLVLESPEGEVEMAVPAPILSRPLLVKASDGRRILRTL